VNGKNRRECGIEDQSWRKNYPGKIHQEENRSPGGYERAANQNPPGTEDGAQDSSNRRIVLVKRLKEVAESYMHSESLIHVFQRIYVVVKKAARAVNVPVVKKIRDAVENPVDYVYESEIHPVRKLIIMFADE
jgi:hypothetical protein